MYTYQDFEKESSKVDFISRAIQSHLASDMYRIAELADEYDHQRNRTINDYVRTIWTSTGSAVEDFTASNNKIPSNLFHRLNTQRCMYLLGNGVSFSDHKQRVQNADGSIVITDTTKERLGSTFDTDLQDAGYKALIHGVTFGFWNLNRLYVFPVTEFVPLWDENTGVLRAGIRFWRLDKDKPATIVLYEEEGYTKYQSSGKNYSDLVEVEPRTPYKVTVQRTEADGERIVGSDNYSSLPVVPLWGSKLKQSTLVGMRQAIDSYDLIRSGFANDLTDCSQIYWVIENCGGMSPAELARFRDRLKIQHIAVADTDNASISPHTQEIPYQARKQYLDDIKAGIYEDFGGLDVHTIAAGATNDHIDAAYQPMDEEADDFEFQIIKFVQQILSLIGIEDTPQFKRNRVSNQTEQTQTVLLAAQYLDDETILQKLPFISVDEVQNILARKDTETGSLMDLDANSPFREGGDQ